MNRRSFIQRLAGAVTALSMQFSKPEEIGINGINQMYWAYFLLRTSVAIEDYVRSDAVIVMNSFPSSSHPHFGEALTLAGISHAHDSIN